MFVSLLDFAILSVVRSLFWLLAVLPEKISFFLARAIVSIIVAIIPGAHKTALRNTELVFPEKSFAERKAIVLASYNILSRNLLDFAQLKTLPQRLDSFDCADYLKTVKELREQNPGSGILAPTIHFGSFELIVQLQALIDRPIAVLARRMELPMLDRWWNKRRSMYGSEVFDRNGGYKQMVARLQNGQDVAVLFDQNVKINHAMFVSFFGIQAATTKSIALAALRTNAPVLFVTSARTKNSSRGGFEFITAPIPSPQTFPGTREEQMLAFTEAIHREIEIAIRKYPEQWFWIHRRFKTRPAGERSFY